MLHLCELPDAERLDPRVVKRVLAQDPMQLTFVPELHGRWDVVACALRRDHRAVRALPKERHTAAFFLRAWRLLAKRLTLLEAEDFAFRCIPLALRRDRAFVEAACRIDGFLLCAAPPELQGDARIARIAVGTDPSLLRLLPASARDDPDVAFEAFAIHPRVLYDLPDDSPLRHDVAFAVRCGATPAADLRSFAWFACQRNRDVVLAFAQHVVEVLLHCREHFEDAAFCARAVAAHPRAWRTLPGHLRAGPAGAALARIAITAHLAAFHHLPIYLCDDVGFLRVAARAHGSALLGYAAVGHLPELQPWLRRTRAQRHLLRLRHWVRVRALVFWWAERAQRWRYHASPSGGAMGPEAAATIAALATLL